MRIELTPQDTIERYLGNGWASPESDFIWALGSESWLMLPVTPIDRPCYFSMRAWPHTRPGKLDTQRLTVHVNGYHVADFAISGRQRLACLIEPDIVHGKEAMCIRLSHPDHARPVDFPEFGVDDTRSLAIAYESIIIEELDDEEDILTHAIRKAVSPRASAHRLIDGAWQSGDATLPAADILTHFQSIGDDCEFGFLQRHKGLEPISLLRFASISIDDLTRGLRSRFAGIAAPDGPDIYVPENAPNHDYMGAESRYGLLYHTGILPLATNAAALKAKEIVRLKRLAEKLIEDIENGDHIFVVKYKDPPMAFQLARLLAAFRSLGPATLLWVRETSDPALAGTAGWLLPGLICAYVDRIDTAPLLDISQESWVAACRAAYLLWAPRSSRPAA